METKEILVVTAPEGIKRVTVAEYDRLEKNGNLLPFLRRRGYVISYQKAP